MRRTLLLSIVLISLLPLSAARRPRYGGTLRVEMRAAAQSLDTDFPLPGLVFETLVRIDDKGAFQPWLATSWIHESARKRWVFTPRVGVTLHNGALWDPGTLAYPDDLPIEAILRNLARPHNAIAVRNGDGQLVGTGPFRVTKWEAGKSVTLAVHDAYWGARPFLDDIELQMGKSLRDQALDFDLGKADLVEVPLAEVRRLRQRGATLATTRTLETLALDFGKTPPELAEAVAYSLDREAIHSVILQRQGESTGALLPQWLTGYAFAFAMSRDLDRAKGRAQHPATLTFEYDQNDPMIRAIGERIAVNAMEAGITLKPVASGGNVRMIHLDVATTDATLALADVAAAVQQSVNGSGYEAERALLDNYRIVPLFHLPAAYQIAQRVKGFPQGGWIRWPLDDVWVTGPHP